jgi:hypothetical protein
MDARPRPRLTLRPRARRPRASISGVMRRGFEPRKL